MESALSPGGAGKIYEHRVAAGVLAALFRGDQVPGLTVPIAHVDLQHRSVGLYLDDAIVRAMDESADALSRRSREW